MQKLNKRKCANCGVLFQKKMQLQSVCGGTCAYELAKKRNQKRIQKEENLETKAMKESLMTKPNWMALLQVVFNTYIRLRDAELPCISCGTTKDVEYAAGHYFPTTYSYLRFNPMNVHKQCNKHCNMMLRGNLHEYRKNLEKKIGTYELQKLHNDRHMKLELSIDDIKNLIKDYKIKIKELKTTK